LGAHDSEGLATITTGVHCLKVRLVEAVGLEGRDQAGVGVWSAGASAVGAMLAGSPNSLHNHTGACASSGTECTCRYSTGKHCASVCWCCTGGSTRLFAAVCGRWSLVYPHTIRIADMPVLALDTLHRRLYICFSRVHQRRHGCATHAIGTLQNIPQLQRGDHTPHFILRKIWNGLPICLWT
jgi:hypothetical protein